MNGFSKNKNNVRIVVVSNMYPSKSSPNYGTFVQNFIHSLVKSDDFCVQTILIKGRGRNLFSKLIKYVIFYFKFSKALFNKDKLFYVHFANHSLIPLLFFKKEVLNRIIVNFHGGDFYPNNFISRFLSFFTKKILPKLRGVVVPSAFFEQEVANRLNINEEKIFVSPSGGIDTKLFSPSVIKQNKRKNYFEVGFVGRLDPGKGFDLLLKALLVLWNEGYLINLHVVGNGTYHNAFRNEVEFNRLSKFVFFHGMQPHEKLPAFYNLFDVLVFPSKRESLGLVGLEAMACGVPVVGSDIGGITTYLKDGANGFVFQPGDLSALVSVLKRFLGLPSKTKGDMSNKARETAMEFDQEKIARDMNKFLKNQWEKIFLF